MPVSILENDDFDHSLRERVHPTKWVNPKPADRYHLVVIGGGPAGLVAAAGAAGLGARVALVESHLLGGDCLNAGCVPSKTLLHAAQFAAQFQRAREFGWSVASPSVDFAAVMARVRQVRSELASVDAAERFRSMGVDVFFGNGVFRDRETVEVNGSRLRFQRCIIATGSRPQVPNEYANLLTRDRRLHTNESIFTLTELPKRMLVIGAGPVGCELGQAFARLGSQVTLVAHHDRVLPGEPPEASAILRKSLESSGITIVTQIKSIDEYECILLATGRLPNVSSLNLPAAEVVFDSRLGIQVDDKLRTTNADIYAIGDVCTLGYRFTHAADAMARIALRNALFPGKASAANLIIPRCTYTDPEVATVGLTKAEAEKNQQPCQEFVLPFEQLDRAVTAGQAGFLSVRVENGSDRILGATVVGPSAGELIGSLTLAMTQRTGLKKLSATVFPYPTLTESLRKIGDQYNRTRLTPFTKKLLTQWFRWR